MGGSGSNPNPDEDRPSASLSPSEKNGRRRPDARAGWSPLRDAGFILPRDLGFVANRISLPDLRAILDAVGHHTPAERTTWVVCLARAQDLGRGRSGGTVIIARQSSPVAPSNYPVSHVNEGAQRHESGFRPTYQL